jgi:cob(I)alamin adenosyltransferase
MAKLYTRRGDGGKTDLWGLAGVPKDDPGLEACGSVDELNCVLGWAAAAAEVPLEVGHVLQRIQHDLFELGAELAAQASSPSAPRITATHVALLEAEIDRLSARLPELRNFILPGGSEGAARLHVGRAVCRRAERALVRLASAHSVSPFALAYLNRLSDLLFALARRCNQRSGTAEQIWAPGASAPGG